MKRKLSKDEISNLLDNFFEFFPKFLDKDIIDCSLSRIYKKIFEEIENLEIEENNQDILKSKLESMLLKSIIPYGESVGIITAQSLGEKQTQMTLNSFHSCGLSLSTVVTGVPRFLELLNISKDPKNSQNSFLFQDKNLSLKDMKTISAQNIKCIRFKDLIQSHEISLKGNYEFWYDAFFHFYPTKDKFQKSVCISYNLDKDKIYRNQICFLNLKKKIEEEFEEIILLFSPIHLAKIHILIDYEKITQFIEIGDDEYFKENLNYFFELFYEENLRTKIEDIVISGIPKITDFFVEKAETNSFLIQTNGSNLKEILKLNFVDIKTVKSNDLWDIYLLVGIEGVRKFLNEELTKIVNSEGGFINNCHITLLVDTMTVTGSLTSISRYGIKKDKGSVLSRSSFEESLDHFIKASFFSEKETVTSVSASIMCGKHCNIGSGLPKIIPNWSVLDNNYENI